MKSLHHYLAEAEKQYNYKVKVVCQSLDDDQMAAIERILAKYDLVTISNPKKTVFQSRPMDFDEDVKGEINIISVTTRLPMSGSIRELISRKIGLPLKFVAIRGENDPLEDVADMTAADLVDIKVGESDGEDALLNTKLEDSKVNTDDYYGDKYNEKTIKDHLAQRDSK